MSHDTLRHAGASGGARRRRGSENNDGDAQRNVDGHGMCPKRFDAVKKEMDENTALEITVFSFYFIFLEEKCIHRRVSYTCPLLSRVNLCADGNSVDFMQ